MRGEGEIPGVINGRSGKFQYSFIPLFFPFLFLRSLTFSFFVLVKGYLSVTLCVPVEFRGVRAVVGLS